MDTTALDSSVVERDDVGSRAADARAAHRGDEGHLEQENPEPWPARKGWRSAGWSDAGRLGYLRWVNFKVSIQTLFVCLLVAQTLAVGAGVAALSLRHGNRALDDLAAQLADEVGHRIEAHVERILSVPTQLNDLNADAMHVGGIDPLGPTGPLERLFYAHVQRFPVSLTYLGNQRGDYVGARRLPTGEITVSLVNESTQFLNERYETGPDGGRTKLLLRSEKIYDTRARPWYGPAIKADGHAWTDIYTDYSSGVLGVTASRPIKNSAGEPVGVLATDLMLDDLTRFLASLELGESGQTFITDRSGILVSTSSEAPIFTGPRGSVKRLHATESADSLIAAGAKALEAAGGIAAAKRGTRRLALERGDVYLGVVPYTDPLGLQWVVCVVLPRSDFTAHIDTELRSTLIVCALAMLFAALVGFLITRRITRPLAAVSEELRDIAQLELSDGAVQESSISEVAVFQESVSSMKRGLRSFAKYVPRDLVRRLLSQGHEARLGVLPREITMLFCDIAGFTPIVESTPPAIAIAAISEYMTEMDEAIRATGGTVCQFTGDGLYVLYGAPDIQRDHAIRACRGAIALRERSRELCRKAIASGKPILRTRIGVNTGRVLVGNIGAPDRFVYAANGDAVNTASRIEGLNKVYKTEILIGERTAQLVEEQRHGELFERDGEHDSREFLEAGFILRAIDLVRMKGKAKPVRIYEVLREAGPGDNEDRERADAYDEAFKL
jgi:adenylate cyclase